MIEDCVIVIVMLIGLGTIQFWSLKFLMFILDIEIRRKEKLGGNEMNYKFKKGDRVRATTDFGRVKKGFTGTVIENDSSPCVAWDNEEVEGYEVCGYKNVRVVHEDDFELIKFTKSDLQNGDRVYDNDPTYEYGVVCDEIIKYGSDGPLNLGKFNEDLTHISVSKFDIIRVERPVKYETVFEREEKIKELTMEEVCEMAGCTVKIVDKKEETT